MVVFYYNHYHYYRVWIIIADSNSIIYITEKAFFRGVHFDYLYVSVFI